MKQGKNENTFCSKNNDMRSFFIMNISDRLYGTENKVVMICRDNVEKKKWTITTVVNPYIYVKIFNRNKVDITCNTEWKHLSEFITRMNIKPISIECEMKKTIDNF